MKKYFNYQIRKSVIVQSLQTIESLDLSLQFSYPEETHDFFEFIYVDNGNILCNFEQQKIKLEQGDFFLIPPQKKHSYEALKTQSASVFIVCFRCNNADILSILDKKISLVKETKLLFADIVKEAKNAFSFPFNKKLKPLENPLFGAQQLVETNIEKLLIHLIRNATSENDNIKFVLDSGELENNLTNDLIKILKDNLYTRVTLGQICEQTYYSKTFLNDIFKKNMGYSIMQYYNVLKIHEAKRLLRENVSPSVVANRLNFESPTYFTKVFKKYAHMTPTAYKKTIL